MDNEFEPAFVHNDQGDRSASVVNIDLGKHVAAMVVCAAICGVSVAISVWAAVTAQIATTEYRVELNHTMQMQAQQDVLIAEVQELKYAKQQR